MKKAALLIVVLAIVGAVLFARTKDTPGTTPTETSTSTPQAATSTPTARKAVEVIAEGLTIPWDIAFLPGGDLLVTERPGKLTLISNTGAKTNIPYEGAQHAGEGGLLGLVLHPNFETNHLLYLYLSTAGKNETVNRVERYKLDGNTLGEKKLIIDNIPGALYHDGGRMEFGPDKLLYITTGDATRSKIAQDKTSLGGKILRLNSDGSVPENNPFGTAVYSYGHRNPQGLAWDSAGRLWETEHGRSGIVTGMDELNLIEVGKNYGWPEIEGDEAQAGMVTPSINSGANKTWAPASLAYLNGSLFYGGLRGEALYEAVLNGEKVSALKEHFTKEFGRIRTVRVGPDGMLYLTTSNKDDRGTPKTGDDKIIKIDPSQLK